MARGDFVEKICAYAKRLRIDLLVLGHYPQPKGGYWWSGPQKSSLAEQVNCCVLVAMEEVAPSD